MKKILTLVAIACAVALLVSCGTKDDKAQVKEVIEGFMKANASADYDKLKSLVTPESLVMIEQMEDMSKNLSEEAKKIMIDAAKSVTFDAESIEVGENAVTATAATRVLGPKTPIALKKVDGKWLIDMVELSKAVDETYNEPVEVEEELDIPVTEEVVE